MSKIGTLQACSSFFMAEIPDTTFHPISNVLAPLPQLFCLPNFGIPLSNAPRNTSTRMFLACTGNTVTRQALHGTKPVVTMVTVTRSLQSSAFYFGALLHIFPASYSHLSPSLLLLLSTDLLPVLEFGRKLRFPAAERTSRTCACWAPHRAPCVLGSLC